MRRRGARPLTELYRRFQRLDDGAQRELAEYLVALAHRVEVKGGPEAMLVIGFLAIDAGLRALPRWLTAPDADGNPFLDDTDRAMLAAFGLFVEQVREARRREALGPSGRVRVDVFLREQGLADDRIEELEKRAYRFLGLTRDDGEAPEVLRGLPAYIPDIRPFEDPGGGGGGGVAAAAAAAAAVALFVIALLAVQETPRQHPTSASHLHAVFAVDVDGVPHVVLGESGGGWRLIGPGGVEEVPPPLLKLPFYVDGGTAGDLDGDGRDELVLFSSAPLEIFERVETGIWIYTRKGGGWAVYGRLSPYVGGDEASCLAIRERIAREALTPALVRAREGCPSRIGAVRVHDRALWVMQLHYGRQLLRSPCDEGGCAPLERVLGVGADLTSGAWLDDAAGVDTLVAGTGCWSGGQAYRVLAFQPARDPVFTWTGGRTSIAPIDGRRFAVLVGAPCDGLTEQPMVAVRDAAPIELRARELAIAEVDAAGRLRWLDRAPLDRCCAAEPGLTVLRGPTPLLAVATLDDDRERAASLRVYRLDRPLAAQRPAAVELPAEHPTLAAIDLDGDGADELAVGSAKIGAAWYAAGVTTDGVALTRLRTPRRARTRR